MKKNFLLLAILATVIICGCKANTNAVDNSNAHLAENRRALPFNSIEVDGAVSVVFTQADSFSIRVEGTKEELAQISTTWENEKLSIENKKHIQKETNVPIVFITSPDLIKVEHNGVGTVNLKGLLDTDILELEHNGVGTIKLERLLCDKLEVDLSGVGNLMGKEITAQVAKIDHSGVGKVNINFKDCQNAKLEASGVGSIVAHFDHCKEGHFEASGVAKVTVTGRVDHYTKESDGITSKVSVN